MTKKEFKKKNKEEKTTSYKLMLTGSIASCIALILLVPAFLAKFFSLQLTMFSIAFLVALVGMSLDLMGEYKLNQAYREYKNKEAK